MRSLFARLDRLDLERDLGRLASKGCAEEPRDNAVASNHLAILSLELDDIADQGNLFGADIVHDAVGARWRLGTLE